MSTSPGLGAGSRGGWDPTDPNPRLPNPSRVLNLGTGPPKLDTGATEAGWCLGTRCLRRARGGAAISHQWPPPHGPWRRAWGRGGSLKGGRTPGGHLPRPTGGGWRSSGCPGMGAGGAQVLRGGGEAGCGAAGLPRGPMWPPAAAALSGAARGGMRRHRG